MESSRFDIQKTSITGLRSLQRKPFKDNRGYLDRIFCADELQLLVPGKCIVQINHTRTTERGTVRGLHFQHPPFAETKLVSCLRGEVYDVAVDLRAGSPTFLHYHAEILSAENNKTLVIPEGFAHGFQTLAQNCEMLYLHTVCYHAEAEDGLNARDPKLGIRWPLTVTQQSARDLAHTFIGDDFQGVML